MGRYPKIDLTGMVHGDYTVIGYDGFGKWTVRCLCGATDTMWGCNLRDRRARRDCTHHGMIGLTARETDIARLVADGLHNKEIARRLAISVYTVKNILTLIYAKTSTENRTELARLIWLSDKAEQAITVTRKANYEY